MARRRTSVCITPGCPNLRPCPTHGGTGTGYSTNRDNAAHIRFARAVKARDRYRCVDCDSTEDLRACHLTPISQGGDYSLANGVTRCATCDKTTDPHAR